MSSTPNRRESERVDAKIDVQFRTGNEFVACYSQNISRGGIALETVELPDPNALVELVLKLPPELKSAEVQTISLRGRVVRLMSYTTEGKTIHKIALQFVDIPPQTQAQLDTLYSSLSPGEPEK